MCGRSVRACLRIQRRRGLPLIRALPLVLPSPRPRHQVLLYPSKSEGMFVPESLIFRSDSNGEDLQGYAGAGEATQPRAGRVAEEQPAAPPLRLLPAAAPAAPLATPTSQCDPN